MRAVLDPNVVISGVLSSKGAPAQVLRAHAAGEFELIASPQLLDELERALSYPKLRRRISEQDAAELIRWVTESAFVVADPASEPPVRSADPDDDYLIALAASSISLLVSGDKHLLVLRDEIPVFTARAFLEMLAQSTCSRPLGRRG